MRQTRNCLLVTAALAIGLLTPIAVASAGGSPVVPPNGKVAGKGYGYWMERFWQYLFASGRLVPGACHTVTVGEQQVALLSVGAAGPGPYSHTCSEPAGRPIYLQAVTGECSTFSTDHNGFGTSPSQLTRCAHALLNGVATAGAWVDGRPVGRFTRFVATTGVYPVHVTDDNHFKIKRRNGLSVAYGSGLLLSGLGKGTHTIWVNGDIPSAHVHIAFTYTVHVH